MSEEQWGPWIDHDGSARPLMVGTYIQIELEHETSESHAIKRGWKFINRKTLEGILSSRYNLSWGKDINRCLRYRIRKPKGLSILQDILREVEDDGGVGYKEREKEEANAH